MDDKQTTFDLFSKENFEDEVKEGTTFSEDEMVITSSDLELTGDMLLSLDDIGQVDIEDFEDFESTEDTIKISDSNDFMNKINVVNQGKLEDISIKMPTHEQAINHTEFGRVNIMVIGIGSCGANAINRMLDDKGKGVSTVAIDTDAQTLESIAADYKLLIGEEDFRGHGSGGETAKVEKAFLAAKGRIQEILKGVDMLFVAGGIGRGTGSVGLVEVGKIAREMGILTIGFATLPRRFDSDPEIVKRYYPSFVQAVDSNIIVENEKIGKIARGLPLAEALKLADAMLVDGIKGIYELITKPGRINLDYADIRTAFSDQGSCIMGIGYGKGQDKITTAIKTALHSELTEIDDIKEARTIIFTITCAPHTITIEEATKGTDYIYESSSGNNIKHLLFGYSYDESLGDKVKVTFIATGTEPKDVSRTSTFNFDSKPNSEVFDRIDLAKPKPKPMTVPEPDLPPKKEPEPMSTKSGPMDMPDFSKKRR